METDNQLFTCCVVSHAPSGITCVMGKYFDVTVHGFDLNEADLALLATVDVVVLDEIDPGADYGLMRALEQLAERVEQGPMVVFCVPDDDHRLDAICETHTRFILHRAGDSLEALAAELVAAVRGRRNSYRLVNSW